MFLTFNSTWLSDSHTTRNELNIDVDEFQRRQKWQTNHATFPSFFPWRLCRRYIGVREPHRRAYKQMVDVEYETLCENGRDRCTKTRPGYKTVFRTVYKTTYKCATDLKK